MTVESLTSLLTWPPSTTVVLAVAAIIGTGVALFAARASTRRALDNRIATEAETRAATERYVERRLRAAALESTDDDSAATAAPQTVRISTTPVTPSPPNPERRGRHRGGHYGESVVDLLNRIESQ